MAITSVYFVRHAQSDQAVKDEVSRPLTSKGFNDAKRVTKTLKDKNIAKVYSSPYRRTMDTVKDLSDYLGYDIQPIDDFRERKVGKWLDDYKNFSKKQWEDFDFKLEDGESLREAQIRNVNALNKVVIESFGTEIVIGTHGTALSTIINYYDPKFGYEAFWDIIDRMPYVLCFKFEDQKLLHIEEIELQD